MADDLSLATGFELTVQELRARQNAKWCGKGPNLLPAPVAEMDFSVAPAIQDAICRIVDQQDYGYPKRVGFGRPEQSMTAAFADRMQRLYGWTIDSADVVPLADLVQATFAAFMAFSEEGDGIILQVPAYTPFFDAIHDTGRTLLSLPMIPVDGRHEMDMDQLAALASKARILTICNPQNPTGRVLTRAELEAIGAIAVAHDLVIVSDEIHAELTFDGHRHIPISSLSPEIAARTVTLNSPTKSFNIPGLRSAVMHFGSAELKERFLHRFPKKVLGQVSAIGMDATVAAWDGRSDLWLDDVRAHLGRMRTRLSDFLAAEMPEIRMLPSEGTYLAWLDCSALGLNVPAAQFFEEKAAVGLSGGEGFAPDAQAFVRLNFATSQPILDEILSRMAGAVRTLRN